MAKNIAVLNVLPYCSGLLSNGQCKWLSIPRCKGNGCGYLGRPDSKEMALERLRNLDKATQLHIAQKYYGGRRPWKEKEERNL